MTTFLRTHETYEQGARTLGGAFYTDPEIFQEERRRIFGRLWVCAGRAEGLAGPGAYRLVEPGDESLILLRDEEGRLRAFHNVCRHRGTRLCAEEEGRLAGTIQCPYHGWTYGLDGALRWAAHMEGVEGFDPTGYPLHAAGAGEWEGFAFASLAPDPRPLEEWLAPLVARFSRYRLGELRSARRIGYDVRANWKLLFQNYSECLHCPTLHPTLVQHTVYDSGENDLVDGPFLGGFLALRPGHATMSMSGEACAPPVGPLPGEDLRRVYYYTVFPNLLLSLHPDYAMVHTLWPEAPDRTRVACEWLFHPGARRDPRFDPDDAVEFWDLTNREDWGICEMAQRGVSSQAYAPGPYSPRESLLAAWDREYLRHMGEAIP